MQMKRMYEDTEHDTKSLLMISVAVMKPREVVIEP